MYKKTTLLTIIFSFYFIMSSFGYVIDKEYDVVIYGGTSAGISAAIQCSRMNKSVLLIETTNRIGGLTTGGLGATDIGSKIAIGGISREFYQNVKKYYEDSNNWLLQDKTDYSESRNSDKNDQAMWTFEPSVALKIYKEMLANESVDLVYNKRLLLNNGVVKDGLSIISIKMESGEVYKGKLFIDTTYEGDLMASAGVSYTVGRESNKTYGETLNGVQLDKINTTIGKRLSNNALHHNFINKVDPYIIKGDPSSGLLPYISNEPPGVDGEGDNKIQAYCFRMTLTDHPANRIPFKKPENYNELNYELLFRNYEAAEGPLEEMYNYGDPLVPWINTPMPNRKTDTNNQKGFSTDFIGKNYDYPEASYERREQIIEEHLNYQKGLMWTLAYHPRIPEKVRNIVSQWGVCKDEYIENEDNWTRQLYIREARRMVSDYVMTQKNCEGIETVDDAIAMAGYGMDSHHVQRYVDVNGYVQNEGNVEARGYPPYPISFRSITPKKTECSNLLVPVCLSASHIAFGSLRMEPVFMILGQSAAIAASQAIEDNKSIQDIDYPKLLETLLAYDQIISINQK
ncbi:MAG: FAD-dependent oxidoreductase [Proteiniphilum sp.]|nr:FAD-dependent oxidoreductase [Proteiniphilum sp.]